MNWQSFYEQNKALGYDEALRQYRIQENKRNQEEFEAWAWAKMNEAKSTGSNTAAGALAAGGGSAVGAALFAPNIVATPSTNLYAVALYWGTIVHANRYVVQRATDAAFTQNVTTVYTGQSPVQAGVPAIADQDLTANTTYYYRVKAQDTNAVYLDSPYGAIASATTISGSQHYGAGLGVDNI
jgi:hypothetical protein